MRPSEVLERHRSDARAIIARYPLEYPRIFGSTARGSDAEGSDVDILVRLSGNLSYFDLSALERELATLMGVKVDVRTEGEFSAEMLERISRDFVAL
ncbi:putative nucleotidyltransferase [Hoeflea sp. IMCC20628]|uniref:nucleotidyltransferase family protein n=1 Tax=Hoeflea sp. IMCC20628 TaxID=1620421 RepID=UPI00063AB44E|nr:nucleotidyltransferase domain-containing protein [Hoeflea sp. IMCC20628]AKI00587.1 putative nucleotidyltransferase [Hoeflea sp. IMCC20628]